MSFFIIKKLVWPGFDSRLKKSSDFSKWAIRVVRTRGRSKARRSTNYFSLDSMKPEAWEELYQRFLVNDSEFQKFSKINYVQYDLANCTGVCKAQMVCGLFVVTTDLHSAMSACMLRFGFENHARGCCIGQLGRQC